MDLTVSRMARLLPCYGGAMIMAKYKCIYAVEWIVNVGTSTIGDEGFPG